MMIDIEKAKAEVVESATKRIMRKVDGALVAVGILILAATAAVYIAYKTGQRDERSEPQTVQSLVARADSNIVFMQRLAVQDSARANEAGLNVIYWRGVKDAFLSLDEDEVRVLKSSVRGQ